MCNANLFPKTILASCDENNRSERSASFEFQQLGSLMPEERLNEDEWRGLIQSPAALLITFELTHCRWHHWSSESIFCASYEMQNILSEILSQQAWWWFFSVMLINIKYSISVQLSFLFRSFLCLHN